ncbi:MarR family winged helix-turn-helix transcriptional regulator [Umezawaea beigongshangensis]|uniref:MarR family winged helix-turn-helix transcriptional regulator n=1 Tax=Umezawaea beigongshangensis TaxID=2780383 RepID=UPI0018F12CC6|nr:MarR family transcriptional regulator [Umezawaea beigongshangensis]
MTDQLELPELTELTVAVRHLINASRELSARLSRELGVNGTDMAALSLLEQHGPMGPSELAASLGIRSASVTVLIDRLEQAGHVERVRSSSDRRRVAVMTTPSAHRATLGAVVPTIRAIDEISRGLDEHDQQVVRRFLDAVTRTMSTRDPSRPEG